MDLSEEQVEKIKRLYDMYCRQESVKPYEEYNPDAIQAIQQLLDILYLKVSGVNA